MKSRIEQKRCCEAALRIFEKSLENHREEVSFPDTTNRRSKDVDICAKVGTTRLAIEHTLIEPFEKFLKSNHDFDRFITALDRLVSHNSIPTSHAFQLLVPGMAFNRLNKNEMMAVTKSIADSAIANMAVLANPPPQDRSIPLYIAEGIIAAGHGDVDASYKAWQQLEDLRLSQRPPISIPYRLDGVRVTLEIMRNPRPSQRGKLQVIRVVENIEAERRDRVKRALAHKREELERYKSRGYRTALVLESNDIALTSDHAVFEALSAALSCVDAAADDIFFADTCTATYAFRHLVIEGRQNTRWYADWDEFDANTLDTELCG